MADKAYHECLEHLLQVLSHVSHNHRYSDVVIGPITPKSNSVGWKLHIRIAPFDDDVKKAKTQGTKLPPPLSCDVDLGESTKEQAISARREICKLFHNQHGSATYEAMNIHAFNKLVWLLYPCDQTERAWECSWDIIKKAAKNREKEFVDRAINKVSSDPVNFSVDKAF